jgi:hypothetical protein
MTLIECVRVHGQFLGSCLETLTLAPLARFFPLSRRYESSLILQNLTTEESF